jgi:Predicted ATPase (AAA+ superfamily)
MGDFEYRTLDDEAQKLLAETDPQGFVKRKSKTLIIDEVQRVPALLSAVKLAVDSDTAKGQYLLTGSSNIHAQPHVQESLAGRIKSLRLRTLTEGELLKADATFVQRAFKGQLEARGSHYDREALLNVAFRGGYPEVLNLNARHRKDWHRDYIDAMISRDLKEISRIQRQDAMKELLKILAGWSGKFMDVSAIGSGLSIRRPTLETYINALEALYLVERVRPWTKTDYDRVGRQAKLFMSDSGLMASILNWRLEQVAADTDRSGKIVETLVFNELAAQLDAAEEEYSLFHYRDREQREIDFIIENEQGDILAVEVKAGSGISSSDFKHLKWFRDNIAKDRSFIGLVLYSGQAIGTMGTGLWTVPFRALWSE